MVERSTDSDQHLARHSRGQSLLREEPSKWTDRETLLALAAMAAVDLGDANLGKTIVGAVGSIPCPGCERYLTIIEHLSEEP